MKASYSDQVLWGIWSRKFHVLIEFQMSGAYEKGDIELTLKTKYKVVSHESRSP